MGTGTGAHDLRGLDDRDRSEKFFPHAGETPASSCPIIRVRFAIRGERFRLPAENARRKIPVQDVTLRML